MLASHTKILERYIRDGSQDKVAEWQPKVDKLRRQIEEMEGGGQHTQQGGFQQQQQQPQQFGNQQQFSGSPNVQQAQNFGNQPQQPPPQQFGNPNQPQNFGNQPQQQPQQFGGNPNQMNRPSTGPQNAFGGNPNQQSQQFGGNPNQQPQNYVGQQSTPQQFGSPQAGQQLSATERRANEILSEKNNLLTQELAQKDTIIEGKSIEVGKLSAHVKGLNEQLASLKVSASEKQSHLEREIQIMKSEIEEGKIAKARELENQRASMQREVDMINKQIEEKDAKVSSLNQTLGQIKSDVENEAINLGIFINKSVTTFSLAANSSKDNGNSSIIFLEAQQNVGFANMTIRSAVNGDITSSLK